MVLSSEENNRYNDVRVIGDKLVVEVGKPQKGADTLDGGRGLPVFDGREFHGVTIEEPPTSFSPFSLVDCTMLNHFSFNDFIAVAFPDLAGDLDIPI